MQVKQNISKNKQQYIEERKRKGKIMNCGNSFIWQTEYLTGYESNENHVTCKDKRMGSTSVFVLVQNTTNWTNPPACKTNFQLQLSLRLQKELNTGSRKINMKENLEPNTQKQQVEKRADMSIQEVLAELCRAKTWQRVKSVTMTKERKYSWSVCV